MIYLGVKFSRAIIFTILFARAEPTYHTTLVYTHYSFSESNWKLITVFMPLPCF